MTLIDTQTASDMLTAKETRIIHTRTPMLHSHISHKHVYMEQRDRGDGGGRKKYSKGIKMAADPRVHVRVCFRETNKQ